MLRVYKNKQINLTLFAISMFSLPNASIKREALLNDKSKILQASNNKALRVLNVRNGTHPLIVSIQTQLINNLCETCVYINPKRYDIEILNEAINMLQEKDYKISYFYRRPDNCWMPFNRNNLVSFYPHHCPNIFLNISI